MLYLWLALLIGVRVGIAHLKFRKQFLELAVGLLKVVVALELDRLARGPTGLHVRVHLTEVLL